MSELREFTNEELVNQFMSLMEDAHGVLGTTYTQDLRDIELEVRARLDEEAEDEIT